MFRFWMLFGLLALFTPAFAADTTLAQNESDGFRLTLSSATQPLVTGPVDLDLRLTKATDGTPVAVSGMRLLASHTEGITPDVDTIAVSTQPDQPHHFRSNKLYFSDAGLWNLKVEVLLTDGSRHVFTFQLTVTSVSAEITAAARVVLPIGALILVILGVAWRFWRRKHPTLQNQ